MKKTKFKSLASILMLAVLIAFVSQSKFSSALPQIYIENEYPIQICSGEKAVVSGFIKNDDSKFQSYILTLNSEYENLAFIEDNEFGLSSGKSQHFTIELTPGIDVPFGNTDLWIVAEYDGQNFTKGVPLLIKECHNIEIDAPDTLRVCNGGELDYKIYVRNLGEYKEKITLSIDSDLRDLDDEHNFSLEKNQIKSITILPQAKMLAGEFNIHYELEIEGFEDKVIRKETKIFVKECGSAQVFSASSQKQCIGTQGRIDLTIKNLGQTKDEFLIYLGNEEKANLSLNSNEEKSLGINVAKETDYERNFPIEIKVKSKNGFEQTLPIILEYILCNDVTIHAKDPVLNVCKGTKDSVPFKVEIQNGPTQETYTLKPQSNMLNISIDPNIILSSFEKREIPFDILVPTKAGQYNNVLGLHNRQESLYEYIKLNVLDCYDFEVDIDLQKEICNGLDLSYKLTIYNFGEADDEYLVEMVLPYAKILGEYEVKKTDNLEIAFNERINSTNEKEKIILKITSLSNPDLIRVVEKTFKVSNCYDHQLEVPENIEVCAYEEGSIPITLKNIGEKEDKFLIEFVCPSYIACQNKTFILDSEEEIDFSLRYTIPKDFGKDSYCTVFVSSENKPSRAVYSTKISLLEENDCYCAQSEISKTTLDFNEGDRRIEIDVNNCGRITDSYEIKVFGELKNYVDTRPISLSLKPNTKSKFYVTFKEPSEDINSDNNLIKLAVQSKATDFYKEYSILLKK